MDTCHNHTDKGCGGVGRDACDCNQGSYSDVSGTLRKLIGRKIEHI